MQLFWNMTRRSLQLISLWVCLIMPLVLYNTSRKNVDVFDTLILWLGVIYPIVYLVLGLIRQYFDDKNIKR